MLIFLPMCGLIYKAYFLLQVIMEEYPCITTTRALYGSSGHQNYNAATDTTLLDHAINARDIPLQKLILTVAATRTSQLCDVMQLSDIIELALLKHSPATALIQLMVDVHIRHPIVDWSKSICLCLYFPFIYLMG